MNADNGLANDMNFELPEEIRMLKDTVRKFVDKEMIPIERTAPRRPQAQARGARATSTRQGQGARAHRLRRAAGIRRARHRGSRQGDGLGRACAAPSLLPSRGGDVFGPNVSPILYHLNDEQKKKYLLPTIRGELQLVPGADRARRRRRSRRHAHHRRAAGRPLRHQRHEALHHRRRRGAISRN